MQCSVTVVNLIHDTATEIDRPVCHVIPGSSWREKLDTSGGDPQRTVHIRLPPAAGYLSYFQWQSSRPGKRPHTGRSSGAANSSAALSAA